MNSKTKVLIGILAAAAAGAAIGILATSEDGKKLRKKIKASATDAADNVGDWLKERAEEMQELKEKALKKGTGWKNDVKDSISEM